MSISAICILDMFGKPVISRNYRGAHELEVIDKFIATVIEKEEEQTLTPVITIEDSTFAFTKYKNLYLVAAVEEDANMLLVFVFLHKLKDIMHDYFNVVEEESIRDNLVVMHELLDEVIDFGFPQTTDSQVLMEYITQESKQLTSQIKVPPTVTNTVSWRHEGIRYKKNEVFLDAIESVDISINGNGVVVCSKITGFLTLTTKLSGMPELRLCLNDRLLFDDEDISHSVNLVDIDNVKFHQCVRLSKFENDRTISFIPPDGEFELMSYSTNNYFKPPIWVDCVTEFYPDSKIEYTVTLTSNFKRRMIATFVDVLIPVLSDVDTLVSKASHGSVRYVPERNILKWTIKSFHGQMESNLNASFRLPSVSNDERDPLAPIEVKFEIPFFAISGLRVQSMKVIEKSGYKAVIWVRYATKNGNYYVRQKEILHKKYRNL